jgi:thiol-disulfide isomerase/thioredoxin
MGTGLVIVVAALVLALGFGLYRAATDGRFRGTKAVRGASVPADSSASSPSPVTWDAVAAALPSAELGERATLLQFSSAFCAPCRVTRQVLTDVAGLVPGVVHLEVDAEHHLELVRELGIMRTPTTLVLDASGAEATRAMGAPRREAVLATLDGIVRGTRTAADRDDLHLYVGRAVRNVPFWPAAW